ncbi:DUF4349 domain-containing protein [Micromonospora olivasterospora]|uniref:Uncharacterized protein DUF4349 n=1 Tax=Micromonospora olivasterospora TaxID=1880 RepID=A0A562IC29_MICOL|nr:DUF4349 domain-containing protein [Micromonospora olivasterospora]TWH68338.1 uncharacterized protein DUF4349 [Micromonospora olivasterospora]
MQRIPRLGGSESARDSSAVAPAGGPAGGNNADAGGADAKAGAGGGSPDLRVDRRSIIYTGTMRVAVDDVEAAARAAVTTVTGAGGFVGGDERRSGDADARAELTLRVPADRFAGVLEDLAKLGRQQQRSVRTDDVTEETVDLDARIATQRARVESGRKLLARATSIGDLVTLEGEVARREADLASLEAKKRRLADLTALSTITLTLVGPDAGDDEEETGTGFLAGLEGGWKALVASVNVLLTVLGAVLPFAVPLAVVVALLLRLRRRGRVPVAQAAAGGPGAVSEPPPVPAARSAP